MMSVSGNHVFLCLTATCTCSYQHVFILYVFFLSLQSRTPALVFEYVNNTDFKVSFPFYRCKLLSVTNIIDL